MLPGPSRLSRANDVLAALTDGSRDQRDKAKQEESFVYATNKSSFITLSCEAHIIKGLAFLAR